MKNSRYPLIIITSLFIILICCRFTAYYLKRSVNHTNLITGANGHPLDQAAYQKMHLSQQFAWLKKLGMKWYRIDVPTDNNGNIVNIQAFNALISVSKKYQINILPMIYLAGLDFKDSPQVAYNKGLIIGGNFAEKYGHNFKYYELGNEEDLLITKPNTSGSDSADYDINKLEVISSFWKGMIQGIKSHYYSAQIIINTGGWFHYVFFDLLNRENVNYDIIGYHWYSDMDVYSKTVNVDINNVISQRFHKPIWYTELNIANCTDANAQEKQDVWLRGFINSCRKYPDVKAVFIYELLDEPELQVNNANEKQFGILKWDGSKWHPGLYAIHQVNLIGK